MPLTRSFSDTIKADLHRSAGFRREFFSGAVECLITGDIDTGKVALREYINGTVGFIPLGKALGKSPKSLMRMLSSEGNPHMRSLIEIVAYIQKAEGMTLAVRSVRKAA